MVTDNHALLFDFGNHKNEEKEKLLLASFFRTQSLNLMQRSAGDGVDGLTSQLYIYTHLTIN